MVVYNKAIRDKIPEIIRISGRHCTIKQLSDPEFLAELEKKLVEELKEYQESKSIEELVDILEVISRISELKGISKSDLAALRIKKRTEKGGFEKNMFLVNTNDK